MRDVDANATSSNPTIDPSRHPADAASPGAIPPFVKRAAVVGAGALLLHAARRRPRGVVAGAMTLAGSSLVWRGITGEARGSVVWRVGTALGLGAQTKSLTHTIARSATIKRPLAEVRAFFTDPENLALSPLPLRTVSNHERLADGYHRWILHGPLGLTRRLDLMFTTGTGERVLTWESRPDAPIHVHGELAVQPTSDTRECKLAARLEVGAPRGVVGFFTARAIETFFAETLGDALNRLAPLIEMRTEARQRGGVEAQVPSPAPSGAPQTHDPVGTQPAATRPDTMMGHPDEHPGRSAFHRPLGTLTQ